MGKIHLNDKNPKAKTPKNTDMSSCTSQIKSLSG